MSGELLPGKVVWHKYVDVLCINHLFFYLQKLMEKITTSQIQINLATLSNCGNILKSFVLSYKNNFVMVQNRLEYNKNQMNTWTNTQPTTKNWWAAQRLNVSGSSSDGLRYSLVPSKYVERQGINDG